MANVNRPRGLFPYEGGGNKIQTTRKAQVTLSNAVYKGDQVRRQAVGTVVRDTTPGTNPTEIIGVAANTVFANDVDRNLEYWPATQDALFQVQGDNFVAADRGACADLVAGTAPTAAYVGHYPKRGDLDACSGMYLASASKVAATAQLKIEDKVERPDNDWGPYVDLVVRYAESAYIGGSGV